MFDLSNCICFFVKEMQVTIIPANCEVLTLTLTYIFPCLSPTFFLSLLCLRYLMFINFKLGFILSLFFLINNKKDLISIRFANVFLALINEFEKLGCQQVNHQIYFICILELQNFIQLRSRVSRALLR